MALSPKVIKDLHMLPHAGPNPTLATVWSMFNNLLNHATDILKQSIKDMLVNNPDLLNEFVAQVETLFDTYITTIDIPQTPALVEKLIYAQMRKLIRPIMEMIYEQVTQSLLSAPNPSV